MLVISDFSEFIASFLENLVVRNEQVIVQAFKRIDKDSKGKISRDEMKSLYVSDYIPLNEKDLENVFLEAEQDGDGEVTHYFFVQSH